MTTIDYASSSATAAPRATVVTSAIVWASNAFRAWKNRRQFYKLAEMTDVELHDIGLTRGDLAVPSDLPFTYDPTSHLGRVARMRANRMEVAARSVC